MKKNIKINKVSKLFIVLVISLITLMSMSSIFAAEQVVRVSDKQGNLEIKDNLKNSFIGLAQKINLQSNVNAISMLFAQDVIVEGNTEYLATAGQDILAKGKVEKEAFVAGRTIEFSETSSVGKNLYVAGETIVLNGEFDGDVYLAARTVELVKANVKGNIYVDAEKFTIKNDAKVEGKVKAYLSSETATIDVPKTVNVTKVESYLDKAEVVAPTSIVMDKLYSIVIQTISGIILYLAISAFCKKAFDYNKKAVKDLNPGTTIMQMLYGLSVVVVVPVIALILMITVVGTPLAVILILLEILVCMVSSIFFANFIAEIIVDKTKEEKKVNLYTILVIFALKLLELLPIIGPAAVVISLTSGVAIVVKTFLGDKIEKIKE